MKPPLLALLWASWLLGTLAEGEGCNRTSPEGRAGADAELGETGSLRNVSVSDRGRPDSLFLSWAEPAGGALGYSLAIYALELDGLLQNVSAGPNATSFQFQGLVPGARYRIEVTAAQACAQASSQRVSGQTSPAPVHNVSLSSRGSPRTLHAAWAPASGQKDAYRLLLYHLDSQRAVRNESVPTAASAFLFEGLLPGSEYALRISTLTGARQASTSARQWTAPTAPAELTLQSLGSTTSLFASWSGAEGAAWLHLTLHNLLSRTVTKTVSATRGLSNYTFHRLRPGTPYQLEVNATAGPHWAAGPNATAWTYPLSPANVTLSITGEAGSLQACWAPPAGERDYYLVTLQQGESGALARNTSVGGDGLDISFGGLSPGSQYSVRVTAVAGPHRASSPSATAWTEPLAPSGATLSSQGSTSALHARWKEATGAGYVAALYSLEPPALVENSSVPGGVTHLTYEGLSPGTHYAVEISTVAGPYASPPLRVTNWTYPSPVEELNLLNQGRSTSLLASWKAAGGRVNYTGVLLEAQSQAWVRNVSVGGSCANVTVEGLSPGRQYTLQMAAVAGPYSSPVRTATDWTHPSAPSGVVLTSRRHPPGLSAVWHTASGDRDRFLLLLYDSEHVVQQNVSVGPDTQNFTFLGLLPGSQYSVEVLALAGPYRASAPSATAWTYPLSLANVSVTRGPGPRGLRVGWTESGGARDHWVLLYAGDSPSIIRNVSVQRGAAHLDLDGLEPGAPYRAEVVSQAGPHRSSSQAVLGYTAPLPPLAPAVTNEGSTSALAVHWAAPAGQRDAYLLRVQEEGSLAAGRQVTVGQDSTNVSLAGLAPGTCYHVGISALAGPYSSEPQNASGCTVPAAPANVSLSNLDSSSMLRAAWDEPPGCRDHYRVILHSLTPPGTETAQSLGPDIQGITWTRLAAGSRFTVQVTAMKGPYESSSVNVTQWTYPLAPANLTLASPSASALQASWAAAEGGGEGHAVDLYSASSGAHLRHVWLPWGTRNHTFRSLAPGTRYRVGVSTTAGPYHASTPNLTHWTRPLAPLAVRLSNRGHPDRLSASWEAAAGGREGYALSLSQAGSGAVAARAVAGQDAHGFTFTALTAGSLHTLEVVSVAGPYRAAGTTARGWTHPLPPLNVSLRNEGRPDRLSASWGAAAGGRDGYTLTLCHAGSGAVAARASLGKDAHNFTFADLAPGSRYLLQAASLAGPYEAAAGNVSDWTCPLAPPTVDLTSQRRPDRLTASWGVAAGGRDGYTLTLYHARAGAVAASASVGEDVHNFSFSGLAPGQKYLLEVASTAGPCRTSAGNVSDWTAPLVPAHLSAVPGESGRVLAVSWRQAASQQDQCQLWLQDPRNNTLPQSHTLAGGQVQHVFQGLVPGRNYSVSLSCVAGPYWSSTGVLVVPIAPAPLEDVRCQPDSKGFSLSWAVPAGDVEACELVVERLAGARPEAKVHVIRPRSEATLRGLEPDSSYRISLSAVGKNGLRGRAVMLVCNTTAEVLPPPVHTDVLQVEAGSTVLISPDAFGEENGRIEYYAVVATTNASLVRPTREMVSSTWFDHYYGQKDSYVAVLLASPFQPGERRAAQPWAVPVGTQECGQSREICNGKLKANAEYRFSVAAFTKYDRVEPSVSFTRFSAAGAGADPSPVVVPVAAGIGAGFLLTFAALFGWVCWKRVRTRRAKKSNLPQEMATYSFRNVHRPIAMHSFKQHYEARAANANQGFFQEFEELKEVGKEQSKVEAELPANVSKNRYPHVLPYDHSRVRLSQLGEEPHSDYINANFIPGYSSPREFIVTQGPLKKTIEDFWRLVWEQGVCTVIMLTVGMENGRVLCDHYWPSESSPVTYGNLRVDLLSQSSADEWTLRAFKLWHETLREERRVSHLHYTAWPDHGIPESTASLMAFLELAREHVQAAKGSGPTLVHCSAGVGRSGTFIALDRLLQQLKQEKAVDVFNTIYTMRRSRYQMIQTLGQYVFLHSCLLEKITEELLLGLAGPETSCPIPLKSFMQHYAQKSAKANAGFLREFEILLEVAKDKASSEASPASTQESRPGSSILPYDRSRVKFSPLEQGSFSDLSHAWLLPGCSSARDYLAVHGPDKGSLEEFWRVVWDHGVHTIVTLLPCQEKGQVLSEAGWPLEGSPVRTELLTVQRGAEKHVAGWRCIQLKLKHEKKAKERQVQRFLYPLWGIQQQPEAQPLVEFLAAVRRCTPHRKRAGPLLLHCSTGVGQMGTLIALDCLLHQMKAERSVDIYGVTLRLTRSCCLMTPTPDQYVFLYTCIRDILAQRQP